MAARALARCARAATAVPGSPGAGGHWPSAWRLAGALLLGQLAAVDAGGWAWSALALVAWALYAAWLARMPGGWSAAALAVAFGLGLHGQRSAWVWQTLLAREQASAWAPVLGTLTLLAYLVGLGAVVAVWWQRQQRQPGLRTAVAFGLAHGLMEWTRALPFAGEPVPGVAHAWVDTALAGWVPYIGGHGLSGLLLVGAGLAAASWPHDGHLAGRARTACTAWALLLCMAPWLPETVQAHGPSQHFRIWSMPSEGAATPARLQALEDFLALPAADLLITPESALPLPAQQIDSRRWQAWLVQAQAQHSHLLLGLPVASPAGLHNSLLLLGPGGIQVQHKHLLMPWGEYTPAGFAWLARSLGLPPQDLQAGRWSQRLFQLGSGKRSGHNTATATGIGIGSLICQEEASSQALQRWLPAAHLLVNVANLRDFAGAGLAPQRLRMVQMRALEAGRPVLRAAHHAPSAHIDHRGRVVALHRPGEPGHLQGQVQAMTGHTPYLRWAQPLLPWAGLWMLWVSATPARRAGQRFSACAPQKT